VRLLRDWGLDGQHGTRAGHLRPPSCSASADQRGPPGAVL